jgi:hypothetical protein
MPSNPHTCSFAAWDAAEWYLEHSAALPPSVSGSRPLPATPRFRLWDRAISSGCETRPFSLTVFEVPAENGYDFVVREVVWRWWLEMRKHATDQTAEPSEPTLVVRDGPVPASELNTLLAEAESFWVPAVWLQSVSTISSNQYPEGFEFFSLDQPPAVLRLQWSDGMPESWGPILEWWRRLHDFLRGCLAAATSTYHTIPPGRGSTEEV